MILFTILLCALIAVTVITLAAAIIGGGSILIVFGDVVVFGLIMWGLIKIFTKKKK